MNRKQEPHEIRIYVDSIQILNYPGLAKWINLEQFIAGKIKGRKYRNMSQLEDARMQVIL